MIPVDELSLAAGEPAAAEAALGHTSDYPALGQMMLQLYRKDWRRAGESAYALIGEGRSYSQIEAHIALRSASTRN